MTKWQLPAKLKQLKLILKNKVYYNMADKPGISNLIAIYSALAHKTIAEVEELFQKSPLRWI